MNNDDIITCKNCGKKYLQWTEDQVPGFRDVELDICPYCHNVNRTSMEHDFHNRAMEEN